jgi:serine/threonine protein kinase
MLVLEGSLTSARKKLFQTRSMAQNMRSVLHDNQCRNFLAALAKILSHIHVMNLVHPEISLDSIMIKVIQVYSSNIAEL